MINKFGKKIVILLSILVFLGVVYLISAISIKLDLSNGQAYTLSSSTKKILKNLDKQVVIKFFASSDLPTKLIPLKTEVVDLLSEYQKEGRGKIRTEIKDPKKDTKVAEEATSNGIPQLQFSQLEMDKYAVTSSFFGMSLEYNGKKEIIPQVTDIGSLEYNLDASIYRMVNQEQPKVGIVGIPDSLDPSQDDLGSMKKVLSQQFLVNLLNISEDSAEKTIDPSIKTILVFSKDYSDEEITELDKYLKNGGNAIFFTDGVAVSDNLTAVSTKNSLVNLSEKYGIKINDDLVLSASAELVNFGNGTVNILSPYPFWLKTNVFDKKVSYFSNINQLTLPWVSSLTVENKPGLEVRELIKTTTRSWRQKDNFILDPQSIPQPKIQDLKSYIVAAQVKNKKNGVLVVIPSSRFILERYLGSSSDNLEFVLNIVNDLASSGALSGIRQRAVTFYPLPDMAENQKDIFKYSNILLLPGLFAAYGIYRLMKRK